MNVEPRIYQQKCVENFRNWINTPENLASITIPVGTGKTITAALCLSLVPDKKILWVSHRAELNNQALNAITTIIPNRSISLEMAEYKGDVNSDIIVGSVQTIARQRKHLDGFNPDIIVVDEWHHFSENNIQYASLFKRWPNAKTLALTATPFRASGEQLPLGNVLIQMDIGAAVEKGYLVPPVPRTLQTDTSLADVKTKMGDFVIGDLSKAINTDKRNELIVSNIVELVKSGRQGICFAADVEHSKSLCSALKKEIRAVEVYGDTPAETRRNIMESIRSHNVDCIVNNMIFTEGTDIPHLSFVCMARPTRFLGLYIQAVGRGLRKCPEINKKDCIVIDVNDKIKVKQTRVTFVDMAVAGDLYGEKKRATNVLQAPVPVEPISNKLKNFPIIISKTYADRWTVDEDAFSISSWLISQDQWIVTWSSETKEPKLISRSIYAPWTELPPYDYNIAGRSVKHATFGQGTVVRIVDRDNPKVVVDFGWSNQKTVEMESLNVQKFIKEFSPSETETIKIDKLFYICVPDLNELGRVIHFVRQGKDLILRDDQRLDKFQIDAYLQGEALKDNVLQLVRTNAKWKMGPASDKQKKYVSGVMDRIGFDLDLDDLTKGEASAVIEQVKWQEIIYAKFGTDHKNKLMGYDTTTNDL